MSEFTKNKNLIKADDEFGLNESLVKLNGNWDIIDTELDSLSSNLAESTSRRIEWLNVTKAPYNATGDGTTNDTAAIQTAIDYATANGIKVLYLPYISNGKYKIDNIRVTETLELVLDPNVILLRNSTLEMITIDYTSTDIFTVSAMTNGTSTSTVTISNATGFKRGDVIKVYSDDIVPNVNNRFKQGEHKIVYDVNTSTNTLTLMGKLRYTYSTNTKIVRLADKKFTMKNAKISVLNQVTGQDTAGLITVYGGKYHKLENIRVLDYDGTAVKMAGCYGYEISGVQSQYQKNGEAYDADGKIGYTVVDQAGGFYKVSFTSGNVRHPFTANGTSIIVGGEQYGLSEHGLIHNSVSNGGSYSSICNHEGSYNVKYSNIKVTNAYGYGATMRGYNHVVDSCEVYGYNGLTFGNYLLSDGTTSIFTGNYTINNTVINVVNTALYCAGSATTVTAEFNNCKVTGSSITLENANVTFNNCKINVSSFTLNQNCTVVFNNCDVTMSPLTTQNGSIIFNNCTLRPNSGSLVYAKGDTTTTVKLVNTVVTWEATTSGSTRHSLVEVSDVSSTSLVITIEVDKLSVYSLAGKTVYLYYAGGTVSSITINTWGLFIKPLSGLVFTAKPSYINNATIQNLSYGQGSIQQVNSTPTALVNGNTVTTLGYDVARVSPASAVTGIILQTGTFNGQRITIVNEATSANTVTFAAASSNVADGSSDVINGGTARTFIWNAGNSLWYRIQ